VNLVVETRQGRIRGEQKRGVGVWRAIPYAEPPLGELRFLPPRPPRAWDGERDGTRYSAVAMQSRDPRVAMMSGITDAMAMSEDCLQLDVYAPTTDGAPRPVLVWIHGGAFVMGAGSLPLYSGVGFASRHDLVVVTVNYRLGLLGLMYLGELGGERYAHGNVTLLDQLAALHWVRDNIAAFGGDPAQVTVMGESAGAISIANLLGMPAARNLFQRAILESGASPLLVPTREDATALAREALDALGVGLDTLAQVPAERIVAVQEQLARTRGLATFAPYVDGVTLPQPPIDTVRSGEGAPVPLLVGYNRDEWTLFDLFLGEPLTQLVIGQVRGRLGPFAELAHAAYRAARPEHSAHQAWVDVLGELSFRIPQIRLAEAQAARAPVHMYRFDWASSAFEGRLGAAHAMELPFVWNRLDNPLTRVLLGGDAPGALELAAAMHDTWAAFVRTGDPNGAGLPAWPAYDARRRATLIIDRASRVVDDPDSATRTIWPL